MLRKSMLLAAAAWLTVAGSAPAARVSDRYDRVSLDVPDAWTYADRSEELISRLNLVSPDTKYVVTVNAATAVTEIAAALGIDIGESDEQRARSLNRFWAQFPREAGGEQFFDNPMGRDALGFWTMHTSWIAAGFDLHGFSSVRGEELLEIIIGVPAGSQKIPDEVAAVLDSIRFDAALRDTDARGLADGDEAKAQGTPTRYDRFSNAGIEYQVGISHSVTVFLAMTKKPNQVLVYVVNHGDRAIHFSPHNLAATVKTKRGKTKNLVTFSGREWEQKQRKKAELHAALVAAAAGFQAGLNATTPVQSYTTGSFRAHNTWDFTEQYQGTFSATTWRWPTPEEVASRNAAVQQQARAAVNAISQGLSASTANLAYSQTVPTGQSYGGIVHLSKGKFDACEVSLVVAGTRFDFAFHWR